MHVRRPRRSRSAQGLQRRAAANPRQAPLRRDAGRDRRAGARIARRQFPHRGRRGRHPRLRRATSIASRRTPCRCFPSSASRRTARTPSISARELAKAEIAFRLGKRYRQDEPLDFGCAIDRIARRTRPACAKPAIRCARRETDVEQEQPMPMIRECIVTTVGANGQTHIAPLGLIEQDEFWIIAPFRPSTTLANLEAAPFATASFIDDVRIFAGCVCGASDWPLEAVPGWPAPRLAARPLARRARSGAQRRRSAAPALFLPNSKNRLPRAVSRVQPRPGGGRRGRDPGDAARHAAARKNRHRTGVSADRRSTRRPAPPSARRGSW